jgi:hypothetical protein
MRRFLTTSTLGLLLAAVCAAFVFAPGASAGKTPPEITAVSVYPDGSDGTNCWFHMDITYSGRVTGRPADRKSGGSFFYSYYPTQELVTTFRSSLSASPTVSNLAVADSAITGRGSDYYYFLVALYSAKGQVSAGVGTSSFTMNGSCPAESTTPISTYG